MPSTTVPIHPGVIPRDHPRNLAADVLGSVPEQHRDREELVKAQRFPDLLDDVEDAVRRSRIR